MWIATTVLVLCLIVWMSRSTLFQLPIVAFSSGVSVSYLDLLRMQRRGADVTAVVSAAIVAHKANLRASVAELAAHSEAGGDVQAVTEALLRADRAGAELSFAAAAETDVGGRDSARSDETQTVRAS